MMLASSFEGLAMLASATDLLPGSPDRPDLDTIALLQMTIPAGVSLVVKLRVPPPECNHVVCRFIRKYVGSPVTYLMASGSPAGVTLGVALGEIVLTRNGCGNPTTRLTEVSLSHRVGPKPSTAFQVAVSVFVSNVRQSSDECDVTPPEDRLDFVGAFVFTAPATFTLSAAMVGVWKNAFGFDFVHIGNLAMSVTMDILTLSYPGFESSGTLQLGRNCFLPGSSSQLNPAASCVGGAVWYGYRVGLGGLVDSESFFRLELRGLTLLNVVKTFGSAEQVAAFEASGVPGWLANTGFPRVISGAGVEQYNPIVSYSTNPLGSTTITRHYLPGGLYLAGTFNFFGWEGSAEIAVNPRVGFTANVSTDALDLLGGALKLARSRNDPERGPDVQVQMTYGSAPPTLEARALVYVSFMGVSADVELFFNRSLIFFEATVSLWDAVGASVLVSASYTPGAALRTLGFRVRAELDLAFVERFVNATLQALDIAAEQANAAFDSANDDLQSARDDLEQAKHDDAEADAKVAELNERAKELTQEWAQRTQAQTSAEAVKAREKANYDRVARVFQEQQAQLRQKEGELAQRRNELQKAREAVNAMCAEYQCGKLAVTCWASKAACETEKAARQSKLQLYELAVIAAQKAVSVAAAALDQARKAADAALAIFNAAVRQVLQAAAAVSQSLQRLADNDALIKTWAGLKVVRNAAISVAQAATDVARSLVLRTQGIVNGVLLVVRKAVESDDEFIRIFKLGFDLDLMTASNSQRTLSVFARASLLGAEFEDYAFTIDFDNIPGAALALLKAAVPVINDIFVKQ